MISKPQTVSLARKIAAHMFDDMTVPTLNVRFVKKTPARTLKYGFCRLVPDRLEPQVTLHVRHSSRREPSRLLGDIVHELAHARQLLGFNLFQDPDTGRVRYMGDEYWFKYNVFHRCWTVCRAGSHTPLHMLAPWEAAIQDYQREVCRTLGPVLLAKFNNLPENPQVLPPVADKTT